MREKLFFLITPDVLKEIYKAAKNASISMGKVNEAIKEVRASLPQYKDTYTTHIVNPDQKVRIHLVD
jgi:polyribonucleotide nucleotidyltransferase